MTPSTNKEHFSSIYWHDCKLLKLVMLPNYEQRETTIFLDVSPVVGVVEGKARYGRYQAIFEQCSFLGTSYDFPYLMASQMNIDGGSFYENVSLIDDERVNAVINRYKVGKEHLFKNQNCFFLEMMEPGGEILILAEKFTLVNIEEVQG